MERSGIKIAGVENATHCRRGLYPDFSSGSSRPAMGHAQKLFNIIFCDFFVFVFFYVLLTF